MAVLIIFAVVFYTLTFIAVFNLISRACTVDSNVGEDTITKFFIWASLLWPIMLPIFGFAITMVALESLLTRKF